MRARPVKAARKMRYLWQKQHSTARLWRSRQSKSRRKSLSTSHPRCYPRLSCIEEQNLMGILTNSKIILYDKHSAQVNMHCAIQFYNLSRRRRNESWLLLLAEQGPPILPPGFFCLLWEPSTLDTLKKSRRSTMIDHYKQQWLATVLSDIAIIAHSDKSVKPLLV